MPLLSNGKITIPLYHGTNLLFKDSIEQHGLGGRDLIKELRIVELLRDLIVICENSLPPESEWIVPMSVAKIVASQEITPGNFNFRHGSVYMSASVKTALRYSSNEFGSEALTQFMCLWERLQESRVTLPLSVRNKSQPIVAFASGKKAPLVFQFDDLDIDSLTAENGSDPKASLDSIEPLISSRVPANEMILQNLNFELHKPISVVDTKIFRVLKEHANGSGYSGKYSLEPYCDE
jgi:hypothetical protein